jgi:hypothetical protein
MLKLNLNGNAATLTSLVLIVATAAVLLYRMDLVEAALADDEKRLNCIEKNQRTLDENQRNAAADVALANAQLRKLLELEGVTERIERPKVEPTKLKDPG